MSTHEIRDPKSELPSAGMEPPPPLRRRSRTGPTLPVPTAALARFLGLRPSNSGLPHLATGLALALAGLLSLPAAEPTSVKPLYQNDFQQAAVGQVPEDLMVLEGAFAVRAEGTNKFLELPGAPVEDFSVLFGPSQSAGVAVEARIHGTSKGRRYPVLAVGLNGVGGYKMPVAPAKKALELFKGDERLASVPFTWESDTWTVLRLQVRKVSDGLWKVEGKAWKEGAPEPPEWMISYETKEEPHAGRAMISGQPFAGTPIRFDDLRVLPAIDKP